MEKFIAKKPKRQQLNLDEFGAHERQISNHSTLYKSISKPEKSNDQTQHNICSYASTAVRSKIQLHQTGTQWIKTGDLYIYIHATKNILSKIKITYNDEAKGGRRIKAVPENVTKSGIELCFFASKCWYKHIRNQLVNYCKHPRRMIFLFNTKQKNWIKRICINWIDLSHNTENLLKVIPEKLDNSNRWWSALHSMPREILVPEYNTQVVLHSCPVHHQNLSINLISEIVYTLYMRIHI